MAGEREAWRETGVVTAIVWDAKSDACPFCLEMNGKVIGMNENFWDKGDSLTVDFEGKDITLSFGYSAIAGPPLHPNCKCGQRAQLMEMDGEGA